MLQPVIGVSVVSTINGVRATFRQLQDRVANKATVRALNRALDQSATEASRKIREVYNIRHGAILKAMKKIRAGGRLGIAQAEIRMRGGRFGLIEFDARWTRNMAGASILEKRAGGRKTIAHSFITTIRSGPFAGYRGVAIRAWLQGHFAGKEERDFYFLRGISLPAAFRNKAVIEAVRKVASESFLKNFRQQIKFLSGD